jgi:hypothetical protein
VASSTEVRLLRHFLADGLLLVAIKKMTSLHEGKRVGQSQLLKLQ